LKSCLYTVGGLDNINVMALCDYLHILDWILPERPMLLTTSHVRLRPDRLLETHLLLLLWLSRGLPRLIGASDTRTTDITLTYAT